MEDKPAIAHRPRGAVTAQTGLVLGLSFFLLLVAGLMTNAANAFVNLGRTAAHG